MGIINDENFIEQAEYLDKQKFQELSISHPREESILKKLIGNGAKLLIGPRGCGKSTLLLQAYYKIIKEKIDVFPIYVNFKLSLKLEPIYTKNSNASYWFKLWLNLKTIQGIFQSCEDIKEANKTTVINNRIKKETVEKLLEILESGSVKRIESISDTELYDISSTLKLFLLDNQIPRCVIFFDDAAHAFSQKQQEDFFDFFRKLKSREIAPKAAIYPGITENSPTFHIGHDAEDINVWIDPTTEGYIQYITELTAARFGGNVPDIFHKTPDSLSFVAFCSFGIPRAYLNMLRTLFDETEGFIAKSSRTFNRSKIISLASKSAALSHNVYDSLNYKLPSHSNFIQNGNTIYKELIESIKGYNRGKEYSDQAYSIGIKTPISNELDKVIGFLQYSGLLVPDGNSNRGVKGNFKVYTINFGDLINDSAIGSTPEARSRSVKTIVESLQANKNQAYPRVNSDSILKSCNLSESDFILKLPNCQKCSADRINEHAKFCHNCGASLKSSSIYDALINQDISILPISERMLARIKSESNIRKIQDIILDSDKTKLRSISYIGEIRATQILSKVEEFLS